uniref:Uncharacterized protein n=1 Tax=Sphaerodactylus townsendi TaxID=933632 RepID=A0ACB8GEN0_9SAUR
MGNVCGCIRADKGEQCLDAAKAPLSPAKRSPGRKYFKRKSRRKQTDDEKEAGKIEENEEKISAGKQNLEETTAHPRESVIQKSLVNSPNLLQSRKVITDLVKTELLGEASCDSCTGAGTYVSNQRGSKSEEEEAWLNEELEKSSKEDISNSSTQEKEFLHDGITGELTFRKSSDGLNFQQKACSDSVFDKLCEENASRRNLVDSSEGKNSERLDHFELQNQSNPVFSSCGCPSFPDENATFSISANRSKVSDSYIYCSSCFRSLPVSPTCHPIYVVLLPAAAVSPLGFLSLSSAMFCHPKKKY